MMKNLRKLAIYLLAGLLLVAVLSGKAQAQTGLPELVEQLKSYHYGASAAPLDQLVGRISESRSNPTLRTEAARALASVLTSNAAFEAKQFACRQLVFVAGDEQILALTSLLPDENLAHYALYALDRIHSPAVASALLKSLPSSAGKTEIEILNTLAGMGETSAVSAFSDRINAKDTALREAALSGLAKIADKSSVHILRKSYSEAKGADRALIGHALLECASLLMSRDNKTEAENLYSLLEKDPASPILEAAALRGLALSGGEKALPLLLKALDEEGTVRQRTAAMALREIKSPKVTAQLAAASLTMKPGGQRLAVEILGDLGDKSAGKTILMLCKSPNPDVRIAALHACRILDDVPTVMLLLQGAASKEVTESEASHESLMAMRGASVDKALLTALDMGSPAIKTAAVETLGLRQSPGIAPRLVKAARSTDSTVRNAALHVLREQGTIELLPSLIDLLLSTPPADRDSVLDAVTQIARRSGSDGAGNNGKGLAILQKRLNFASKPEDKVALLSALGQMGGPTALNALRKALKDSSPEVSIAALSQLAEWPTDEPMNELLESARGAKEEKQRTIALRGYLRMIGNDEQRSPVMAIALYEKAAALPLHAEEKRLILAGLGKFPCLKALEYASKLALDKEVLAEAELALADIGRGTLGAWPEKTRAALSPIASDGISEEARKRAKAVLDSGKNFGDYIVAWEVSPTYQQDGADYQRLFDIPFPPEEPGKSESVAWRPLPVGGTPSQPWLLDLLAQWGGEQKAAYLRTAVWSETARDLSLEMGSDDGLKVWWNGVVALSHNTARAVVPGQEKVTVHLNSGWNRLLLKVTQNNQGWGAVARFTDLNGAAVSGLRYSLPSESLAK